MIASKYLSLLQLLDRMKMVAQKCMFTEWQYFLYLADNFLCVICCKLNWDEKIIQKNLILLTLQTRCFLGRWRNFVLLWNMSTYLYWNILQNYIKYPQMGLIYKVHTWVVQGWEGWCKGGHGRTRVAEGWIG